MARAKQKAEGVGYQRPPTHSQFRKGESGNPKGRPKGSKSLVSVLAKVLAQRVTVTVNGQQQRISKLEAITTQLVNRAASADLTAMRLLLGLIQLMDQRSPQQGESVEDFGVNDEKTLRHLYERIRSFKVGEQDDTKSK